MFNKFGKSIQNLYHGKKGITGLETAIILIAFVTVAAVLAYTVLSAGIFSSERGKEAVYSGLNSAQSTMDVKGSVLLLGATTNTATTLQFTLAMAIGGGTVDLTKMEYKFWNSAGIINDVKGSVTTSANTLSANDQVLVTVDLTDAGFVGPLVAYETITLQIIPPTGATITIQRTLPGAITDLVSLN